MGNYSDRYAAKLHPDERAGMQRWIDAIDDAERRQDIGIIRAAQRFDLELLKLRASKAGRQAKGMHDFGV